MKLEFLSTGSADCPLVRLYAFGPDEAETLRGAITLLVTGAKDCVAVHELSCVEAVGDCELRLRLGSRDRGLVRVALAASFDCVLTPESWKNVAGLIEPFVLSSGGYQWLSTSGDANWLISSDGCW